MLKDITLGQFFPGNSLLHRLDPRTKILATLVLVIVVFLARSMLAYGVLLLLSVTFVLLSRISLKTVLKAVKPLIFIIAFTAVLNIFFARGENILFEKRFLFFHVVICAEGVVSAIKIALRIILLVIDTSVVLTYTTSPIDLTDGLEKLLSPLEKIGVHVHTFAMMMSLALRFIPTLIEEVDKIVSAQKSRGADFASGNVLSRIKALIPILVPLLLSSFRRADELALAMECRCYNNGKGRTRMKVLRMHITDAVFLAAMLLFVGIYFIPELPCSVLGIESLNFTF